ncbi:Uncharacterised protein [Segatella copri]|nr:Uncharacterised protein [Segatella copri]
MIRISIVIRRVYIDTLHLSAKLSYEFWQDILIISLNEYIFTIGCTH